MYIVSNIERWSFLRQVVAKLIDNEGNNSPSKRGRSVLSRREFDILVHVAVGFKDEEIADKLGISPHTVSTRLCNVYNKINVPNRLQAILWATKNL